MWRMKKKTTELSAADILWDQFADVEKMDPEQRLLMERIKAQKKELKEKLGIDRETLNRLLRLRYMEQRMREDFLGEEKAILSLLVPPAPQKRAFKDIPARLRQRATTAWRKLWSLIGKS